MQLLQGDCLELLPNIEDGSIDLTVTSPPYDNLRNYNDSLNWSEDIWKKVLSELYRVTKEGGVVVWVVGDATIKGSETGTSWATKATKATKAASEAASCQKYAKKLLSLLEAV